MSQTQTNLKIHGHDANALALVHDEIQRKVLDEKLAVVLQRLTVAVVRVVRVLSFEN